MSDHAVLAPSSAPIWAYCAGAPKAEANYPDIETPEARDGTAAHWVFSESLVHDVLAAVFVGETAPNGVVVDEEMADSAAVMVAHCEEIMAQNPGGRMFVEYRVTMPGVHPQNWGTLDFAYWLPGKLWLRDFKHGHESVDATSWQLKNYAIGLGMELTQDPDTVYDIGVVQPRCYRPNGPIDTHVMTGHELLDAMAHLRRQANEAMGPNPSMLPGKHCRRCKARRDCAAAKQGGYDTLFYVRQPFELHELNGHELAVELQQLEAAHQLLKGRIEAINEDLEIRVRRGETGTGHTIEAVSGNLNWHAPVSQVKALLAMAGIDPSADKLKTATQVIASAPKDKRDMVRELVNTVARRNASAKLIKAADSQVARAFQRK